MSVRFRLEEPPTFVMHYPTCSACMVDLDHDGDSWICPKCQTAWDSDATDGDDGQLYADWSGEDVSDVPVIPERDAATAPYIDGHAWVPRWPDLKFSGTCGHGQCYANRVDHVDRGAA
jgi:hypothetical protein